TRRQRLVADSGRVSINSTRSPIPAALASSWAFTLVVDRSTLPYNGCFLRSSRATTTVLSILSETTYPSRIFLWLRWLSLMPHPHFPQRHPEIPTDPAHARASRCRCGRCPAGPYAAGGCCPSVR